MSAPDTLETTPEDLEPLVTRVLCDNPSPFTFTGTWTHLVGVDRLAVIDPGPVSEPHHAALLAAIAGRTVEAILITHTHRDHSPGAPALAAATGAPIIGCAPLGEADEAVRADTSFDHGYAPDRVLTDHEALYGGEWTLRAVATPGHTSNHLCFALEDAGKASGALFSGDHVMGWSTTIVSPPDGDMGAYMASLEKLMTRDDRVYHPAHGDPVTEPKRLVRGMIGHRRQREGQVLRLLHDGPQSTVALTARMYAGIDARLLPAAERSVLAHLIDLARRGSVAGDDMAWRRLG